MESKKAPNNLVITIAENRATIYKISYDKDSLIDIVSRMTKKFGKKEKHSEKMVRMYGPLESGKKILTEHGLVVNYMAEQLEPLHVISSLNGEPYTMPLSNMKYSVYEYSQLAKAVLLFMKNPCQLNTLDEAVDEAFDIRTESSDIGELEFLPGIVSSIRKSVCIECPVDDLDGYLRSLSCGNHLEVSKETRKVRSSQVNSQGIINSIPSSTTPIKKKILRYIFNPKVSKSLGI